VVVLRLVDSPSGEGKRGFMSNRMRKTRREGSGSGQDRGWREAGQKGRGMRGREEEISNRRENSIYAYIVSLSIA
jgi:hypothetical protein